MFARGLSVAGGQRGESVDHISCVIADREVAPDQIGVGVREDRASVLQQPPGGEVAKDGATADERFDVV